MLGGCTPPPRSRLGHAETLRVMAAAVAFLLAAGGSALLHAKTEDGFTPLHRAAKADRTEEVRRLLAEGADPDAKDTKGATPLHYAVYEVHAEVVALLLAAGADPK